MRRQTRSLRWIPALLLASSAVVLTATAQTGGASRAAAGSGPDVPRLVVRNGVMMWVNARAFGPVPPALRSQGEAVCRIFDTPTQKHRAAGYHPRALNADGKPFPGGGYFCVPR